MAQRWCREGEVKSNKIDCEWLRASNSSSSIEVTGMLGSCSFTAPSPASRSSARSVSICELAAASAGDASPSRFARPPLSSATPPSPPSLFSSSPFHFWRSCWRNRRLVSATAAFNRSKLSFQLGESEIGLTASSCERRRLSRSTARARKSVTSSVTNADASASSFRIWSQVSITFRFCIGGVICYHDQSQYIKNSINCYYFGINYIY